MLRAKKISFGGLESGVLKPVIDKIFALENSVNAHRYMESNGQVGRS
ncbi:zinc-binding dehydrogenase [Pantoea agglomerans]|nr:zinc-binding dehydrogenase [Pantoea agglomerans]